MLEKLAGVRAIAFDKTGTLTLGRPRYVSVTVDGATEGDVFGRATQLAAGSEHPIARALVQEKAAWSAGMAPAQDIQAILGLVSRRDDGESCAWGLPRSWAALGWRRPRVKTRPCGGPHVVYVGWRDRTRGRMRLPTKSCPRPEESLQRCTSAAWLRYC